MVCKNYWPDYQAMGDCVNCGHTREAHIMTTVTVIIGDNGSGRSLVGAAIATYIRNTKNKNTYALNGQTKLKPINFSPGKLDDLFLVSGSNRIEKWMAPWFERFGKPLFVIRIERHDEWEGLEWEKEILT